LGSDRLPSDPEADTPSGTVYQLPLDDARRDAAPGDGDSSGRDGTADPESSAGTDSPIRSENYFGSSSSVPGVRDSSNSSGGRARDGDAKTNGEAASGTKSVLAPASSQVEPGPSQSLVISLAGLTVLVGAGLGVAVARSRRASR
jgi:hypothetical protein